MTTTPTQIKKIADVPEFMKKICNTIWEYDIESRQVYLHYDEITPGICGQWASFDKLHAHYLDHYVSKGDLDVWNRFLSEENLIKFAKGEEKQENFLIHMEHTKKGSEWHEVFMEKIGASRILLITRDIRESHQNTTIAKAVFPEFDYVCSIDIATEKYTVYYSGPDQSSVLPSSSEAYPKILKDFNKANVMSEEEEELTGKMQIANVVKQLENQDEYVLYAMVAGDGKYSYKKFVFRYGDEEKTKLLLARLDVDDVLKERKLREREEKKRISYLENMPVAFCSIKVLLDENGEPYDFQFIYANPAHAKLEGVDTGELIGKNFYEFFENTDRKWLKFYYDTAYLGIPHVIRSYSPEIQKHLLIHTFQIEEGYCECVMLDVTEEHNLTEKLKKSQENLKRMADIDPLTGIFNTGAGQRKIQKALSRQKEEKNGAYNVMFVMDIDDFKTINDTQGHMAGDKYLVEFAALLEKNFRSEDIIYRLGGDEFVVFLENIEEPEKIISRIMERFKRNVAEAKKQYPLLSSSVGIYVTDRKYAFEHYYEQADRALYLTKAKGKNGYTVLADEGGPVMR